MNEYVVIRDGRVVQEITAPYATIAQFFKTKDGDLYVKCEGRGEDAGRVTVALSTKLAEDFLRGEQAAVEEIESLVRLGLMTRDAA